MLPKYLYKREIFSEIGHNIQNMCICVCMCVLCCIFLLLIVGISRYLFYSSACICYVTGLGMIL